MDSDGKYVPADKAQVVAWLADKVRKREMKKINTK
jgi:hypothetical protein